MRRPITLLAGLVLATTTIAGCAFLTSGTAGPLPTPGAARSIPELKLVLVDAYGPLWYCDPDFYPIAHGEEIDNAKARWSEVVADTVAFNAITTKLGMDPTGSFTDDQKLTVYQAWKVLNAIALNPIGNDTFRFDYLAEPAGGAAAGRRTGGTLTISGAITVEQQADAGAPNCPICLARGTRIDAPNGALAVETLRIGDIVWTLDSHGKRIPGSVIALGSTLVPANHHVVHLVLADGRTVTASPGHPLADGRLIGDLRSGDLVDGSTVRSADLIVYDGARTYDLVVSGPTGIYLVDGIPLGSTID